MMLSVAPVAAVTRGRFTTLKFSLEDLGEAFKIYGLSEAFSHITVRASELRP